MKEKKCVSRSYYLQPVKIIRDLVHGYINLTEFELKIIDTVQFQRLKDVRQLTCQHVYPAARHTRFEHSLGVLELTRQAIRHLNRNGKIGDKTLPEPKTKIISDQLLFNAELAALLHDVGHCPFSHLGEGTVDRQSVQDRLRNCLSSFFTKFSDLIDLFSRDNAKNLGAVHEQLSCIVILEKYKDLLSNISNEPIDEEDAISLYVDFELIIRSILGIEYDTTIGDQSDAAIKNVIVRLINSSVFDMDKLDYIMRDSFFTDIGTPAIDTHRLFRNMYFNSDYSLVFTSKAVPSLQSMIDSRDELYMYVYNHHAVVFSDFMNTYILRKFDHNHRDMLKILNKSSYDSEAFANASTNNRTLSLGLIPTSYIFSADAILNQNRSDSDWISLLNAIQHRIPKSIGSELVDELNSLLRGIASSESDTLYASTDKSISALVEKIESTYNLVERFQTRHFLKPWWKTVFEFSNFMNQHFRDDRIKRLVGKLICSGEAHGIDSSEFRSQIAKHVMYITQKLHDDNLGDILEPLNRGDFLVIQRSNKFFDLEQIEKLDIALKTSEITGAPNDVKSSTPEYYIKFLTNIIPQKDYSAIYAKEGFYVFSRPITHDNSVEKRRHYEEIERIFVFVATELVKDGIQRFNEQFSTQTPQEEASMQRICAAYRSKHYSSSSKPILELNSQPDN